MIMHYNNYNVRILRIRKSPYLMHMKIIGSIAPLLSDSSFKLAYPYVHAMLLKCHASYLIVLVCLLLARDCSIVIVVHCCLLSSAFVLCLLGVIIGDVASS